MTDYKVRIKEKMMKEEKDKGIFGGGAQKFFDILGEIMGFLTILLIVLLFAHQQWDFLPEGLATTLFVIREYAIIITVAVVCLEFAAKRGWILFIIIALIVAVAIIFSLLPNTRDAITSYLALKAV